MNGSGCKNCPVQNCQTMRYRGSTCAAQRAKYGLGDPMTIADRIRAMSIDELAKFLLEADQGNLTVDVCDEKYCDPGHCKHDCTDAVKRWLESTVEG